MENNEVIITIADRTHLTIRETQAFLACSRQFLYKLISRKQIDMYKIGGRTYFLKEDVYNLFKKESDGD